MSFLWCTNVAYDLKRLLCDVYWILKFIESTNYFFFLSNNIIIHSCPFIRAQLQTAIEKFIFRIYFSVPFLFNYNDWLLCAPTQRKKKIKKKKKKKKIAARSMSSDFIKYFPTIFIFLFHKIASTKKVQFRKNSINVLHCVDSVITLPYVKVSKNNF